MRRRLLLGLAAWLARAGCFATDERPYAIEDTSYTLEPGRFAVELTPLTYARRDVSGAGERHEEVWSFGYSTLRAGVTRDTEIGAVFESWQSSRTHDFGADVRERLHGAGNLLLRLKHNFFGNDGGRASLSLSPYFRFPTGSRAIASTRTEWGFALPLDLTLTERWAALVVAYGDWLADSAGDGRHFESSVLLDFSHAFATDWCALLECYYQVCPETGSSPIGTLNAGVGRMWGRDLYVEAGTMLGLTTAAPDISLYVSVGRRF